MRLTINIDPRVWLNIGQVGSSIHGNLLKPNDIDICIAFKLPLCYFNWAKTLRIGKYNLIFIHNTTLKEYYENFDMGIVRGYKSLFTRKLYLSEDAKKDLNMKTINQYNRNNSLFVKYDSTAEKLKQIERAKKYINKLPSGWTINLLPQVKKKLERVL